MCIDWVKYARDIASRARNARSRFRRDKDMSVKQKTDMYSAYLNSVKLRDRVKMNLSEAECAEQEKVFEAEAAKDLFTDNRNNRPLKAEDVAEARYAD